ncbi:DUF58 domain-containing protein [Jeotgalibacillus sp. R-1-5s-1]|uniref:DUF58 domain-containing protein n=1 Tax=Jeotgalibacillus sp. R-1-5s-1 TaxID=2555897 RepID=UPI00106C79AC|nr:DUF58 domain-containing protein [Jeotgalibacillus sp. R-1-5s-1]TFD93566.1 DUF58 domain-containing protein [Jeotgalibacillus sp. R-1-5s-1]
MKAIWTFLQEFGKVLLLLVLLAGTFSYAMFQGGFVSWFLFYSFLPFGLYSLILMLYPLGDFKVVRRIKSKELKAGSYVTVQIQLTRKVPVPLFYMIVQEHVSTDVFSTQEIGQVKKMVNPWFRRKLILEYDIPDLPRGEHTFRSVELKTGDFLGIIQKSRHLVCEETILVYPAHININYQPIQARFDQGVSSSNVKFQQDTTMATGVRDYQTGDRVSWIHWKSFARTNDLKTKEFEERKSHDVSVVLDRTPTPAFEDMVVLASSIARGVMKKGAQVGYFSQGSTVQQAPVRSGEAHQKQVNYYLAKVQGDHTGAFADVLKENATSLIRASALMIVTSRLSREMVDQVSAISKNGQAAVIFLVRHPAVTLNADDQQLKGLAASKGIIVKELNKRQFSSVFKEVKHA